MSDEESRLKCRRCECEDLRIFKTVRAKSGTLRIHRVCRHCGMLVMTVENDTHAGSQMDGAPSN